MVFFQFNTIVRIAQNTAYYDILEYVIQDSKNPYK